MPSVFAMLKRSAHTRGLWLSERCPRIARVGLIRLRGAKRVGLEAASDTKVTVGRCFERVAALRPSTPDGRGDEGFRSRTGAPVRPDSNGLSVQGRPTQVPAAALADDEG